MTGHCAAGAVKRALGCAAGSVAAGRPVAALPVDRVGRRRDAHPLPPDIAVVGERAVGHDRVFLDRLHRHRVRLVRGARRDAEEARLGIDRVEAAVGADLHPGDVVADALRLPARDRRLHHRQVGLAAGRREGGGDVELLPLRTDQPQDQHVLGHPALAPGHGRGDAQREALLAEQGVAAVAGAERPDQVLVREVGDVLLLHRRAGPGNVLLAGLERRTDRVQAGHELALFAQRLDDLLADAGHDVHVADDVGAVGDLDADLGHRRAQRPHREGDDVQRATSHAALVEAEHRLLELALVDPVVGRADLVLIRRADVGAVLDPGHVAGVGAEEEAVRALLERDGGAAGDHLRHQTVVLGLAPVAPMDFVGPAECGHLFHPLS